MARVHKKHQHDDKLGERLRQRRKDLGLTGKSVARAAGVSPSYLSQLEHGTQDRPSLEVLSELAVALSMSLPDLLGTPIEPVATALPSAALPPALGELAAELGLDEQTTAMLAGIHIGVRRPATREGWLLIWLAIEAACAAGVDGLRYRA